MTALTKFGALKLACKHPLYVRHLLAKKIKFHGRFKWAERNAGKDGEVPPPLVYKFLLTYRCSQRCKMCMFWGDSGWCKDEPSSVVAQELDWGALKCVIERVSRDHPSFIFAGGEPLLYSHFGDLARLLKQKKCFATVCTNGLLLDRFVREMEDNPYVVPLISLDGLEKENDLIRGDGVYEKVVDNIRLVKSLKNPPYTGIQFTIRPENAAVMYEFCREMVKLNIDWILLNPCWFISGKEAMDYEERIKGEFNVTAKTHLGYIFPYDLDKEEFVRQYGKINSGRWPIQISCYLKAPADIYAYMDERAVAPCGNFCYKQWLRVDVAPSGHVSPCIQFPDILFGNIKEKDILDIWNSRAYEDFRKKIRGAPLPVCKKCDAVYLYDAKRRYL